MYEQICYESPFLKEVVVRIDYPSFLSGNEESLPKKIEAAILSNFPIPEPRTLHAHEVLITDATSQTSKVEMKEWVFHGKDRDKTLIVGQTYLTLSIKKYKNFENLVSEIKAPLEAIYRNFADLISNRIGLRYINVIDIKKSSDPLNWKGYINKDMLALLGLDFNKSAIARVFSIMEYNIDGLLLKAQFGIPNPDYPAAVKQKQFVIDLDAYSFGAYTHDQINELIHKSHGLIQDFFEKSITAKTRNLMKPKTQEA